MENAWAFYNPPAHPGEQDSWLSKHLCGKHGKEAGLL